MSDNLHGLHGVLVPPVGGDYRVLYARLLDLLGAFSDLTVDNLDGWEEQVTLAVHDATGMTLERWDRLSPAARVPWLERTINTLPDKSIIEFTHVAYPQAKPEPLAESSEPTTAQPDKSNKTADGTTWQEVAARLQHLQAQGQEWTSYGQLAEQFGCSKETVYKAVKKTPELQGWVRRPTTTPQAQRFTDLVADNSAQSREPDPADDAAIREFIERADPPTKAWFLALSPKDQLTVVNDPDKFHRILKRKP
jgi:hypothetical protein